MIDPANTWVILITIKMMNGKKSFLQHSIYIYAESPLATVINVFQPLRLKLDTTQTTPSFSNHPFPHFFRWQNAFLWRNYYTFRPLWIIPILITRILPSSNHKIIMHNNFLDKIVIIIFFNIDSETMYSELILSLQQLGHVLSLQDQ